MILKLLLFCTILITSLNATNITWYSSYDKALEEAHKQNKNLMIFISSNKTKKSNEILKKYFINQDYIKYINQNFISVLITIEYKISYPIELYYTTQFPSLFFASHKDESFLTHPIYEFKTKEYFLKVLYSIPYK
jgi:hypothetical protein